MIPGEAKPLVAEGPVLAGELRVERTLGRRVLHPPQASCFEAAARSQAWGQTIDVSAEGARVTGRF
jgi:hypothetical protein